MQEIVQELRKNVSGEVRFDKYSRILYSTDASIYQIEPKGVVIPKNSDDVQAVVETANKHDIPIIPRGGGTSLVGQSIGPGIIVDFSKYMNRIIEVNREEGWARIQPGVVLDQLNSHVANFDLFFGPDVATSSRANLGGLIGNNSSGARSIVYGKTINHILELKTLLADGTSAEFKPMTHDAFQAFTKKEGFLNSIYAQVKQIALANKDEIDKRYPKILRRVAGYNLDEFIKNDPFNLAKMIVGSEGTLALVTEAKVNLVQKEKERVLGVIHFKTMFEALDAVCPILEFNPSAVELIDSKILDPARNTMEYARRMTFVDGHPGASLIVEFQGSKKRELELQIDDLLTYLKKTKAGYSHVKCIEQSEQEDVWFIRKAGLGLVMGTRGARKPHGFVEDSAVPVEHLAEYIREFDKIIKYHKTEACYYAHASVGLLHIRPMLNLKDRNELNDMQSIADAVSDLVLKYGGAFSGEHGDGLARSCFNEKMFGPQLYDAFKKVKAAFDPKNILNPGKIIANQRLTENLRYDPQTRSHEISTYLDFSKEGGFYNSLEMCNGNGVCRKQDTGTMCPSYMVTSEEKDSTRGRANALRAALSGRLDLQEFTSAKMHEVMDLCIACKGCKGECPTNVDMAKIKYEFLYQYHKKHGLPIRDRLFGNIELLNKLGCATTPVSNWLTNAAPVRWFLHQFAGIERQRSLPPFAAETFLKWYSKRDQQVFSSDKPKVVFFNDTFLTYNYPQVGIASIRLLEAAGYDVILPQKKCCGRPFISKGMLEEAKANAEYNIAQLYPYVEKGYAIVGCEPSCILTFREEYPEFIRDERSKAIAENSFIMEEFFTKRHDKKLNLKPTQTEFLLHGHCHMKALLGVKPSVDFLKMIPEAKVTVVDSGCCGMAGSFGFEKEHYDISLAMGERKLFKAVESVDTKTQVVAPGVSCRQQIAHGTGKIAKHPVEIVAEHLV